MSETYRFSTNRKMLINDWDDCCSELTGDSAAVAVGKKYYDVFPRLYFRQKDAVAHVMERRRKLVMKGYVFRCLSHCMTADIMIRPLLTPRGMKGAEINVSNVSARDGYAPREARRLMTMGKTAPALAHGVRNSLNAIHGAVSFITQ